MNTIEITPVKLELNATVLAIQSCEGERNG